MATAGSGQQYEYDAFGNITGVVDGEGNRTQYVLDEWGRIVEIKRADGASEFYRYDYAGNMTHTIDGENNTTRYEYGANGQLIRMTDPTGESETYGYDLGNRLCRMTDRNGIITTYTYNLYGSLTGRRAQNPAVPGTRRSETYEYTPEGLLKSAISSGRAPDAPGVRTMGMRYSYEYDAMNRLIQKSASGRALLSFAYDLNGNLIRQEDVTGKVTQYSYNDIDILENIKDNDYQVAEYNYYPDGTIKSLRNGSLYTEYAYDADRNLTCLKTMLGEEVLADNRYAYDHNGNRTEKQQLNGATRYTYDSLNQLTKVEYPSYTEELYYDRAGNRSRKVSGGMEELYQYDPRNRLTEYTKGGMKTTFTYDNAGNLLADDKARYTYDAFQRTEKVETFDGHIQINRYDAEGLRHELEEDGKLVQFIFRGQEVAVEETENKVIRFIRGYDLIASDAESARTYYHYASDEMGSITHVVTDEKVLNRYEYDAWGNLTFCEETVENRFKFNGQQYDPISQQYYLRARFYNPVIARFTQEDTYRGDGLNLYTYCRNNPVYYVDPSGNFSQCFKEAYLGYINEEGLSRKEAYKAAKRDFGIGVDSFSTLTSDDDIHTRAEYEAKRQELRNTIREYEQAAGINGRLPENQRLALIEAGMRGATLEHVTQNKSGVETIVAYNKETGQIYYQAGTITNNGLGNGTGTTSASRNYAQDVAQSAGYSSAVDYGHLIGRNEGGGGGINDRNGFPQNASINRGEFRIAQAEINTVAQSQPVHVFSEIIYANNNAMPTSLFYSTDIQGEYTRTNFKN